MNKFSMRSLLAGAVVLTVASVFTSCEEKDYTSQMPTFSGFTLNMDAPSRGDSIVITAKQITKGKLINGTTYQWTITDSRDSTVYTETQEVIYDHEPSDPVLGYRIPANARTGRYTVSFYARYKYSGQGTVMNGGNYGQSSDGTNGTINPGASGLTYGECKGSVQFRVVE